MLIHHRAARRLIAAPTAFLACTLAPAICVSAPTTYHVAPCGDDTWTGLSDGCSAPDGPKATIQAAIDASIDGDTVLLAAGTYVGPGDADLDFGGRAITLRSASGGAADCVVEPPFGSRGFIFQSGEPATAVVRGLTVRNGTGFTGGGAVRLVGSGPTLIDCVFESNSASSISGGFGGALWVQDGNPTIINCVFRNNDCGNPKTGPVGRGGAMYVVNGSPELIGCIFAGNTATAAVSQEATGGGIHVASGSPTVTNCVFVSNAADDSGGAIHNNGNLVVRNAIVRGNVPDQVSSTGGVSVEYCNVEGGFPGEQNIDVDPLFVDPDNGDFRLQPGSPCIDAADNTVVPVGIVSDLDGAPRFQDDLDTVNTGKGSCPIVDMGSYEFAATCPWDLDCSAQVGITDLLALLAAWGAPYSITDLLALLAAWGSCPGASP